MTAVDRQFTYNCRLITNDKNFNRHRSRSKRHSPTSTQRKYPQKNYYLYAVNHSLIKMFGEKTMTLNLGLRSDFNWKFVIADVTQTIIGHYDPFGLFERRT